MRSAFEIVPVIGSMALLVSSLGSCGQEKAGGPAGVAAGSHDTMRMEVLRRAAKANGLVRASELRIPVSAERAEAGRLIFESPLMSINGSISCRDCHLDEFGSADGLPNAVGVGGQGKGLARLHSDGRILPRNVLPFWGRGSKGFGTFFWDGKVSVENDRVVSQFGDLAPSTDPLVVAVHLPSVELREMVADTPQVRETLVSEEVSAARSVQTRLAKRFASDSDIGPRLGAAYGRRSEELGFTEVADALASFIRDEFRIRPTALERFVFESGPISQEQLAGGILFYGRGRCSGCHYGPYFSDLRFHAVAFPQAGFGKNGFGIDEGRYNVTFNPADRFLFRTAPLHNVTLTAPYSHSGSVARLEDAIVAHFDPLRLVDPSHMTGRERSDLYARFGPASREVLPSWLTDKEVDQLVAFLSMLEFEKPDTRRPQE